MKFKIAIWSLWLCAASNAAEIRPPQPVQTVNAWSAAADDSLTRLKISLTHSQPGVTTSIRPGSVLACSEKACYRGPTSSTASLVDTANGKANVFAEWAVPHSAIQTIYFLGTADGSISSGFVQLDAPVVLEKGYKGGEVNVVMGKTSTGTGVQPLAAAGNLIRPEGTTVYFTPGTTTVAVLPQALTLTIPAGAYHRPLVLNVAIHDTGAKHPLVDIYPVVDFKVPAYIEYSLVKANSLERSAPYTGKPVSAPPPGQPENRAASDASDSASPEQKTRIEFKKSGVIRQQSSNSLPTFKVDGVQAQPSAAAAASACLGLINHPDTLTNIRNLFAAGNYTVRLEWCEGISPNLHIYVMDMNKPQHGFKHGYHSPQIRNGRYNVLLAPVTDFSAQAVAINGFTWTGDAGNGINQYGMAKGFVTSSKKAGGHWIFGQNLIGGGTCMGDGYETCPAGTWLPDNKKFILQVADRRPVWNWFENSGLGSIGAYPDFFDMVSSSTSVVKNGVCQTDATVDRWSAIGTSPNGWMVFISSTSDGVTSAAELCPIMQGLTVNNALRLDGGPSAAISDNKRLLNPLTGLASFKYGPFRRIAYSLRTAYFP